jgi:hypothetical protein
MSCESDSVSRGGRSRSRRAAGGRPDVDRLESLLPGGAPKVPLDLPSDEDRGLTWRQAARGALDRHRHGQVTAVEIGAEGVQDPLVYRHVHGTAKPLAALEGPPLLCQMLHRRGKLRATAVQPPACAPRLCCDPSASVRCEIVLLCWETVMAMTCCAASTGRKTSVLRLRLSHRVPASKSAWGSPWRNVAFSSSIDVILPYCLRSSLPTRCRKVSA